METVEEKRNEQKKEAWIKNVMRCSEATKEEAEDLFDRIKPFDQKGGSDEKKVS